MNRSETIQVQCAECSAFMIVDPSHCAMVGWPQCCGSTMAAVPYTERRPPPDDAWEPEAMRATVDGIALRLEHHADNYRRDPKKWVSWNARDPDGFSLQGVADDVPTAKHRAHQAIGVLRSIREMNASNYSVPYPVGASDVDLYDDSQQCCALCGTAGRSGEGRCFHPASEIRIFLRGVRAVKGGIPF